VISAQFSGDAKDLPSSSVLTGGELVDPAPLLVTASSAAITYGQAAPLVTPSYSGFVNGDTPTSLSTEAFCSSTAPSARPPVGTYTTSCSGVVDPNYSVSYSNGSVTVGSAPLLITASSAAITYGQSAPAVTPTYSGFVNGDNAGTLRFAPTCRSTAPSATPPAGSYTTSCTGAVDSNYTISYGSGSLDVGQAPLLITASSAAITYGQTAPSVTPTYSGFVNGDDASSLSTAPTCSSTAGSATPAAGSYATSCTGAADANYAISYLPGAITVSKAVLTVTGNNAARYYGAANPSFTATLSGFVLGQNVTSSGVTGTASCSTTVTVTSDVGTYSITCALGTLAAANYAFGLFVPGALTIAKAPTSIAAKAVSKLQSVLAGGPTFSATLTSLVTGKGIAAQTVTFGLGSTAICSATTNANGVATCKGAGNSLLLLSSSKTYTASYSGATDYLASQGTGAVTS
jgi:hypothetical protein